MSLINDALKRAKQAQQQAAPPAAPTLEFRPVEPRQRARTGGGGMLSAALGIIAFLALLALVLVWRLALKNPSPQLVAAKQPGVVAAAIPSPQPPPPTTAPAPRDANLVESAPAATAANKPDGQPPASPPAPTAPATASQPISVTNPPAAPETPPPKPAPLKLQAIVFNPTRPSAMIGGRTLFVGAKVGNQRIVAIDQESATLAGAGQTNVLTLTLP
ncbi:MAG: hypothetical protein DME25_02265 [Verrucomicrobia bacterium]|nr:MAG: hypothetical protein DME25_02265 [Verrucomicrobiota bacterium]